MSSEKRDAEESAYPTDRSVSSSAFARLRVHSTTLADALPISARLQPPTERMWNDAVLPCQHCRSSTAANGKIALLQQVANMFRAFALRESRTPVVLDQHKIRPVPGPVVALQNLQLHSLDVHTEEVEHSVGR